MLLVALVIVGLFFDGPLAERLCYGVLLVFLSYKLVEKLVVRFMGRDVTEFYLQSKNYGFQKYSLITLGLMIVIGSLVVVFVFEAATYSVNILTIGVLLLVNGLLMTPDEVVKVKKSFVKFPGIDKKIEKQAIESVKLTPDSIIIQLNCGESRTSTNLAMNAEVAAELILFLGKYLDEDKIVVSDRFADERIDTHA